MSVAFPYRQQNRECNNSRCATLVFHVVMSCHLSASVLLLWPADLMQSIACIVCPNRPLFSEWRLSKWGDLLVWKIKDASDLASGKCYDLISIYELISIYKLISGEDLKFSAAICFPAKGSRDKEKGRKSIKFKQIFYNEIKITWQNIMLIRLVDSNKMRFIDGRINEGRLCHMTVALLRQSKSCIMCNRFCCIRFSLHQCTLMLLLPFDPPPPPYNTGNLRNLPSSLYYSVFTFGPCRDVRSCLTQTWALHHVRLLLQRRFLICHCHNVNVFLMYCLLWIICMCTVTAVECLISNPGWYKHGTTGTLCWPHVWLLNTGHPLN